MYKRQTEESVFIEDEVSKPTVLGESIKLSAGGLRQSISLNDSFQMCIRDRSSALPKKNNSYFYPSASLSAVLTDLFDIRSNILTFAKEMCIRDSSRRELAPV